MPEAVKYWAFLSYSHTDRKWGDWLHKALETYRVPRRLIGQESRDGKIPPRVYPIFRDREELPVSADLGSNINQALRESRYLIVICSPRSAQSRWVGEEITQFKRLGHEDRILALIIDGEPNASEGKPGFASADECFPQAMRYRLGANGQFTSARTEPIAADAREGKDGRENARLKLLAGLLSVNYDDLKRREQERRIRRLRVVIAVTLALVSGFAGLSVYAWQQKQVAQSARNLAEEQGRNAESAGRAAQQQERLARARLSDNYLDRALALLAEGDRRQGSANLVAALRSDPSNSFAADRLMFEFDAGDWLVASDFLPLPPELRARSVTHKETEVLRARMSADGQSIEASTLNYTGHPARTFKSSRAKVEWTTVLDRRELRDKSASAGNSGDFADVHDVYDFEPKWGDSDPEFQRVKSVLGQDNDVARLLLSGDRKWAVAYGSGEEEAGDSPATIIDLIKGRQVASKEVALAAKAAVADLEFTGQTAAVIAERQQRQKEYPVLFGLPAFDLQRSVVWLFSVHSADTAGGGPVLRAIDLRSGRAIFEDTYLAGLLETTKNSKPSTYALRPRVNPGGGQLFLRHSISNRVGEVVNIFRIVGQGSDITLEPAGENLVLPGNLGDLTKDPTELVAVAPTGIAVYKLSVRRSPQGLREKNTQLPDWGYEVEKMGPLSADGSLAASVYAQGHITVLDRATRSKVSAFESNVVPGEGGRYIRHAEFSPDSRWLLVWGASLATGVRDTEVYDPRSGRLIYPRLEPVVRFSNDGRSVVLQNRQTMSLRLTDGSMPDGFAELAEGIIGAYLDERGIYHVTGTDDSRPIATANELQSLVSRLDPKSPWTKFARERFSLALESNSARAHPASSPDQTGAAITSYANIMGGNPMPGERYPETRLRALATEEVRDWPVDKLQYAINEIYARHGAAFPNQKIQRLFGRFSWYRPQEHKSVEDIENMFSDIERQNVKTLGDIRNSKTPNQVR
jgi:hypothetical protein